MKKIFHLLAVLRNILKFMRKKYLTLKHPAEFYLSRYNSQKKSYSPKKPEKRTMLFVGYFSLYETTQKYVNGFSRAVAATHDVMFLDMLPKSQAAPFQVESVVFNHPDLLQKDAINCRLTGEAPGAVIELAMSDPHYRELVELIKLRHTEAAEGEAELTVYALVDYADFLLDTYRPEAIMLWNKFFPLTRLLDHKAKLRQIPVVYMEFGVLPGSLSCEMAGQMGESWPATSPDFNLLPVPVSAREEMAAHLVWLKESGLNRYSFGADGLYDAIARFKAANPKRPTLLYAGQNDHESGFLPYNEHSKKYHSPTFSSGLEALNFLDDLADKNDWNLLYKPHPLLLRLRDMRNPLLHTLKRTLILSTPYNITDVVDLADVTVTILSQTAYMALIRGKPVVMLGFNQLKNSGAVYEAYDINAVENVLKKAVTNGYTDTQKNCFIDHATRLGQHYLYDDLMNPETGRVYKKAIMDLVEMIISINPIGLKGFFTDIYTKE